MLVGAAPLLSDRFRQWRTPATLPLAQGAVALGLVSGHDGDLVREAVRLHSAPASDLATEATKTADYRLVGIAGFSVFFPGIREDDQERLSRQLGVREIVGNGDGFESVYEWLYQDASYEFAHRYNVAIIRQLEGPMR
jgi:hypothetical protein